MPFTCNEAAAVGAAGSIVKLTGTKVNFQELDVSGGGTSAAGPLSLGLSFNYSAAPLVEDQRNPFVKDNANYLSYGAALVFKYKLDFLPQSARLAQAPVRGDVPVPAI